MEDFYDSTKQLSSSPISSYVSMTETTAEMAINQDYQRGYHELIESEDGKPNSDNTNFWYSLSAIQEDIGNTITDNINNYIENIADVDTCKLKALASMYDEIGLELPYELKFLTRGIVRIPDDIMKNLEIFSIKPDYIFDAIYSKSNYRDVANDDFDSIPKGGIDFENYWGVEHLKWIDVYKKHIFDKIDNLLISKLGVDDSGGEELSSSILNDYISLINVKNDNTILNKLNTITNTINLDDIRTWKEDVEQLKYEQGISPSVNISNLATVAYERGINYVIEHYENISKSIIYCINYELGRRKEDIHTIDGRKYTFYQLKEFLEYVAFVNVIFKYVMNLKNHFFYNGDSDTVSEALSAFCVLTGNDGWDIHNNKVSVFTSINDGGNYYNEYSYRISRSALHIVSEYVKNVCFMIIHFREFLKIQAQKYYLTGTKLLITSAVDEYLRNTFKDFVQNSAGLDDTVGNISETDLTEYYDYTNYSNIISDKEIENQIDIDTLKKRENTSFTFASRYWENPLYTTFDKDAVENFYTDLVSARSVHSQKFNPSIITDKLEDFFDILYNTGANTATFIRDNKLVINQDELIGTNVEEDNKDTMMKYLYLEYTNTLYSTKPTLNLLNTVHASYQIHPMMANFIPKGSIDRSIDNLFFNSANQQLAQKIRNEYLTDYITELGGHQYIWQNLYDYSGYQSRYESSTHNLFSNKPIHTQSLSPLTNYDGGFYPTAVLDFVDIVKTWIGHNTQTERDDYVEDFLDYIRGTDKNGNRLSKDKEKLLSETYHDFYDRYFSHIGLLDYDRRNLANVFDFMFLYYGMAYNNGERYDEGYNYPDDSGYIIDIMLHPDEYEIIQYGLDYMNNSFIFYRRKNTDFVIPCIRFNHFPIAFQLVSVCDYDFGLEFYGSIYEYVYGGFDYQLNKSGNCLYTARKIKISVTEDGDNYDGDEKIMVTAFKLEYNVPDTGYLVYRLTYSGRLIIDIPENEKISVQLLQSNDVSDNNVYVFVGSIDDEDSMNVKVQLYYHSTMIDDFRQINNNTNSTFSLQGESSNTSIENKYFYIDKNNKFEPKASIFNRTLTVCFDGMLLCDEYKNTIEHTHAGYVQDGYGEVRYENDINGIDGGYSSLDSLDRYIGILDIPFDYIEGLDVSTKTTFNAYNLTSIAGFSPSFKDLSGCNIINYEDDIDNNYIDILGPETNELSSQVIPPDEPQPDDEDEDPDNPESILNRDIVLRYYEHAYDLQSLKRYVHTHDNLTKREQLGYVDSDGHKFQMCRFVNSEMHEYSDDYTTGFYTQKLFNIIRSGNKKLLNGLEDCDVDNFSILIVNERNPLSKPYYSGKLADLINGANITYDDTPPLDNISGDVNVTGAFLDTSIKRNQIFDNQTTEITSPIFSNNIRGITNLSVCVLSDNSFNIRYGLDFTMFDNEYYVTTNGNNQDARNRYPYIPEGLIGIYLIDIRHCYDNLLDAHYLMPYAWYPYDDPIPNSGMDWNRVLDENGNFTGEYSYEGKDGTPYINSSAEGKFNREFKLSSLQEEFLTNLSVVQDNNWFTSVDNETLNKLRTNPDYVFEPSGIISWKSDSEEKYARNVLIPTSLIAQYCLDVFNCYQDSNGYIRSNFDRTTDDGDSSGIVINKIPCSKTYFIDDFTFGRTFSGDVTLGNLKYSLDGEYGDKLKMDVRCREDLVYPLSGLIPHDSRDFVPISEYGYLNQSTFTDIDLAYVVEFADVNPVREYNSNQEEVEVYKTNVDYSISAYASCDAFMSFEEEYETTRAYDRVPTYSTVLSDIPNYFKMHVLEDYLHDLIKGVNETYGSFELTVNVDDIKKLFSLAVNYAMDDKENVTLFFNYPNKLNTPFYAKSDNKLVKTYLHNSSLRLKPTTANFEYNGVDKRCTGILTLYAQIAIYHKTTHSIIDIFTLSLVNYQIINVSSKRKPRFVIKALNYPIIDNIRKYKTEIESRLSSYSIDTTEKDSDKIGYLDVELFGKDNGGEYIYDLDTTKRTKENVSLHLYNLDGYSNISGRMQMIYSIADNVDIGVSSIDIMNSIGGNIDVITDSNKLRVYGFGIKKDVDRPLYDTYNINITPKMSRYVDFHIGVDMSKYLNSLYDDANDVEECELEDVITQWVPINVLFIFDIVATLEDGTTQIIESVNKTLKILSKKYVKYVVPPKQEDEPQPPTPIDPPSQPDDDEDDEGGTVDDGQTDEDPFKEHDPSVDGEDPVYPEDPEDQEDPSTPPEQPDDGDGGGIEIIEIDHTNDYIRCVHSTNWDKGNAEKRYMNMLAPKMSNSKYQSYRDSIISRGCDTAHLILCNRGDVGADCRDAGMYSLYGNLDGVSSLPPISQSFVSQAISKIDDLKNRNLHIVLWLMTDDSTSWANLIYANRDKYLKDLKDTSILDRADMIVTGLEVNEYWKSASQWQGMYQTTKKYFKGMVGVHQTSLTTSAYDYCDVFFGQLSPDDNSNSKIISFLNKLKSLGNKPINLFELDRVPNQRACQTALANGAYAVGNW